MWFDAQAALAEIKGHPPATTARQTPLARPVSQSSQESQRLEAENPAPRVAVVARVATPQPQKPESPPRAEANAERYPHAYSALGNPTTWTGRIVSLDEWRRLTKWERHGQDGRIFNALSQQWELPE